MKSSLALALVLVGCGAATPGASYSGSREKQLESPEAIQVVEAIPAGYEWQGRASARCKLLNDYQALSDELLANVDCSKERLQRALRERAAEVGGELLAELRCRRSSQERRCDAQVGRPSDETLAARRPEALAASSSSNEEPRVSPSWAIRLSFESRLPFERPAHSLSAVERSADRPPHHEPLGDASAHCDRGDCESGELVHALRLAAARVGAHSVSAVRCHDDQRGHTCVGTLGAQPAPELK
jgi:hypothetical protein